MKANRVVIELNSHAVLPLRDSRGAKVVCLEGAVWITEERDSGDIILEAGQSYELARDGNTVVQAMSRARIAVEALGAKPQLAFSALPELRAA